MGKTVTIAEAASSLAERLEIPTPEGESSPEFRLSFARTLRIEHLKEALLRKAADCALRVRIPDGGYVLDGREISESSQVDISEAQAALEANGETFVDEANAAESSEKSQQDSQTGRKTTHKIRTRTNPLDCVIKLAKENAVDSNDYHSVWSELVRLAEGKSPPAPLAGYSSDGIQYRGKSYELNGVHDVFIKDALRKRMNRNVR